MTNSSTPLEAGQNPKKPRRLGIVPPPRLRRETRSPHTLTDAHAVSVLKSGRLTERDLRVLDAVWRLETMTGDQVRRLAFHTIDNEGSRRRISNRRLRFMLEERLLDRTFSSLCSSPVYLLDEQGARIIQMLNQAKGRKEIHWSPRSVGESILFMDHRLGVTEFAVSLTEAARRQDGTVGWTGEAMLNLPKRDGTSFRPDGGGNIHLNSGHTMQFLFEWDRGQETLETIAGKIRNYLDLLNHPNAWRKSPHSTFPVLLIVTTADSKRLDNILDKTQQQMQRLQVGPDRFRVLAANWADLERGKMFDPVWYHVGRTSAKELTWKKGRSLLEVMDIETEQPR